MDRGRWRCRKGFLATNVLGMCSYDKVFFALWSGAEGCAHDAKVVQWSDATYVMPPGYYGLFDAGCSLEKDRWLTPFRSTRYHLREFGAGSLVPATAEELFNLRHSVRRSQTIEVAWGLLKGRFKILKVGIDVKTIELVNATVIACTVLHNFIQRRYGVRDTVYDVAQESVHDVAEESHEDEDEEEEGGVTHSDQEEAEGIVPGPHGVSLPGSDVEPIPMEALTTDAASWRRALAEDLWGDYTKFKVIEPGAGVGVRVRVRVTMKEGEGGGEGEGERILGSSFSLYPWLH